MSTKRYCSRCLVDTDHTHNGCRQCARRDATGVPPPTRPPPDRCEACGAIGPVCLDHNHKTGAFRGWLCRARNALSGMHYDDPTVLHQRIKQLQAIIRYLTGQKLPARRREDWHAVVVPADKL